ncbi:hypothetical protein FBU59_000285 [Linderina macrospora]|uniref:Uncharacterized protein n=1 Tax=Linderina macrospora TaxID=4868 RepID=A0ACC1JH95_9FUNG|nr:hypothetical protein FBU59_000285 [Linderina macrospora]
MSSTEISSLHADIEKPTAGAVLGADELTAEEETIMKSYLRKVDIRIALFLCLGYIGVFLNRGALVFGKVDGMEKHLGLKGTQYNTLMALFYPTFLVFQIPLNFVCRKIGARKHLPAMLLIAGTMSVGALGARNFQGMIAIRLLEGFAQAGFISSLYFTFGLWYPRRYLAPRLGFAMSSGAFAGIVHNLVNLGFAKIHTNKPTYAWQFQYLFVGLFAIVTGIYGAVVIRDYPDTAGFLRDEERELIGRLMSRNKLQASTDHKISGKQVIQGLTDWRLLAFMVLDFANNYAASSAGNWSPVILKSIGYSTSTTMALLLVPSAVGALVTVSSGLYIRKYGNIAFYQILFSLLSTVTVLIAVAGVRNNTARTVAVVLFPIFAGPACLVGPTWLNVNMRGVDKSAISNALAIIGTNFGVLSNSYAYLNTDAPRYIKGNSSNFGMFAVAIIIALVLQFSYKRENRKFAEQESAGGSETGFRNVY